MRDLCKGLFDTTAFLKSEDQKLIGTTYMLDNLK